MNTAIASSAVYNDLQGLSRLKADARSAPQGALREAAAQFEGIFFQMMLKSMRDATVKSELFNSDQMETYQQMFDQQLSLDLSHKGGLGLAEILVQQLGGQSGDAGAAQTTGVAAGPADMPFNRLSTVQRAEQPVPPIPVAPGPGPLTAAGASQPDAWQPQSPKAFIEHIWNEAVTAARQLDIEPEVLVAQSALETGWGKKMIRDGNGHNSFNLFGIKANSDWQGASASVRTVEYGGGVAELKRASFRTYNSIADSFSDYVDLIKKSPRYQDALSSGDSSAYLHELQNAGYATDPDYADKILSILGDERYGAVMQALKKSSELPLSVS